MINCLNEPYDCAKRYYRAKRKEWLRQHFKLYKKFDDWFSNCSYTKRKQENLKAKYEKDKQRIRELLDQMEREENAKTREN